MNYIIREIEPRDNKEIEKIIRTCLKEFGADHEGTAWADPDLGRFSEIYGEDGRRYWVAEGEDGRLAGGTGIGPVEGAPGVCELQKMYCLPDARGTGLALRLLNTALDYAAGYYDRCYIETLGSMAAARRFYEKNGFRRVYEPIAETSHFLCDVRYIIDLKEGADAG